MYTRGIDHLAIVADDMPAAMDFYTRVMGFGWSTCAALP